jgi:lipid-A-disaccharide synthase
MSLQCALAGIPGGIVYRPHPLTTWMARRLVRIEHIGIANLLLRQRLYPEYIHVHASPRNLGERLQACIGNPDTRKRARQGADRLREILAPDEVDIGRWLHHQLSSSP